MEMMLPPDLVTEPIRPLKRVEYEKLAAAGCFEDERVELLFGVVVEMTPVDPAHPTSIYHLRRMIERGLGDRAILRAQDPFAASDISEPQQGVKAKLYGLAEVDEYWIVNHVDEVVEVYRDRQRSQWQSVTTYRRGDTIAMLQFPDVTIAVAEILPPPGS